MLSVQYLLESAFCLACLYGFYWLVLRRETFFQWNRAYLLVAPILSFAIPAIHIRLEKPAPAPIVSSAPAAAPALDLPVLVEQWQVAPRAVSRGLEQPVWSLSLGEVLWYVYGIVAGLFLLRLMIQIVRLLRFIRQCRRSAGEGYVLATGREGTPLASFFGYVFWHPGEAADSDRRLMFEHEMVHVRQWHSLDLILIELLVALQWFNPLLYAYRRSLRAVHEYIADDAVVRRTRQRYAYASLLVEHLGFRQRRSEPALTNTFHSLIKYRLVMLAQRPSSPVRRVKYLLGLPVFAALLLLFSFRLSEKIPAMAPLRSAVQAVETYVGNLREVTISAPAEPEPTPYIFYWGVFEARFTYQPATGEYLAQLSLSPDEMKTAIQREPRLWTGRTLLENLTFEINGIAVQSNYYQPEQYSRQKDALRELVESAGPDAYFDIDNISLPDNRTGRIHIVLNAPRPDWIPKTDSHVSLIPPYAFMAMGKTVFHPAEERFVTLEQFQELIAAEPRLYYADASGPKFVIDAREPGLVNRLMGMGLASTAPQQWNLSVYNQAGVVMRPLAERTASKTFQQVRERLVELADKIQPGTMVSLSVWDAEQTTPEQKSQIDTIITFDPTTYEETMQILRHDGQPATQSWDIVRLNIVAPGDPRLFLSDLDRNDFRFDWGSYTGLFADRYAKLFARADGGARIHADRTGSSLDLKHTRSEILNMLRQEPKLSIGPNPPFALQMGSTGTVLLGTTPNTPLAISGFTLEVKDLRIDAPNGRVPAEALPALEQALQPGAILRITGLRAEQNDRRWVVFDERWVHNGLNTIPADQVKTLETTWFGSKKLHRLQISAEAEQALSGQAAAQADGVYFQQGDIDLSTMTLELEVRADDVRKPLPPAVETQRTLEQMAKSMKIGLKVAPNPANQLTLLQIDLPEDGEGRLTVVDAAGVVYYSYKTLFHEGSTSFRLPLEQVKATGLLYVRLEMPYGSGQTTLVVEKN